MKQQLRCRPGANVLKDVLALTLEAVTQRCSIKRCSLKFRKIHRKTPVPESHF